ncbi:ABC transporter ATP-binding protein [Paenibacillus beijingensis]|uniref:Sugar ABC transporter ATP-binding protein n=1 Tax=Paenibacillus beijingensis TaxID=1126833 RepID=A0A0D5NDU6_9BACL|nr:ATP-binding cassette domain-containing protein [Paenibacillus beijingensis]AJY73320.1 sugar ABC transporter ATP-binding protein [Paenibacillus beijingensis]
MSMIVIENLSRDFRLVKRQHGKWGGLKSIFNREYTIKKAVNNISTTINKGEIIGFLGPNGAGKSTTIKMMVGILVPSSGKIVVNGINPFKNRKEHARNIGVVFGQRTQLWWDIPVSETLKLLKYMYKIPDKVYKENLECFFDLLSLGEFIDIPVRQLSLGQRMRADICCSLMHNPEILFLDEPTIGLDVVVKEKIRNFIKQINLVKQTTVILTTHDMQDIDKLCSRVIIIDKGTIMLDSDLKHMKNRFGNQEVVVVETINPVLDYNKLQIPGVLSVDLETNKLAVTYNKSIVNPSIIISRIMEIAHVRDIRIIEVQTEEIIRNIYEEISSQE